MNQGRDSRGAGRCVIDEIDRIVVELVPVAKSEQFRVTVDRANRLLQVVRREVHELVEVATRSVERSSMLGRTGPGPLERALRSV